MFGIFFKEITFIEQGCIKLIKVILFLMLQTVLFQ